MVIIELRHDVVGFWFFDLNSLPYNRLYKYTIGSFSDTIYRINRMGNNAVAITRDALRGYILEEALAYLVSGAGYRLLVHPDQDPDNLIRRGNGLGVKGRGSDHQADVLGELLWIPAFTFPLRLFVEAKFRHGRTGISAVSKAVGVLLDINQRNLIERDISRFPRYYRYEYALFSTSGFSQRAIDMAITHQISLIDLSGDEFSDLRNEVTRSAEAVIDSFEEQYKRHEIEAVRRGRLVSGVRNALRRELRTWPSVVPPVEQEEVQITHHSLLPAIEIAHRYRELFVAMADGPFMLLLKERNPGEFVRYANRHRRHAVEIYWSRQQDRGRTWTIKPSDDRGAYELTFRLPDRLADWIFTKPDFSRRRALRIKQTYFSSITVYRHIDGEDYLYRLEYDSGELAQRRER